MSFNKKFFTTGGIVASTPPAPAGETDYFNPVLYTGNGGTQTISSVGFQPDLVWIKNRDAAVNHKLLDSIRFDGTNYEVLESNTTAASTATTQFSSFDSNGFTLGGGASAYNGSETDYVAWCWKAGGAQSTLNTSGDLDAYVSANPSKGFSIVQHSKQTADSQTIPHGLSSAPKLIIHKNLSASAWGVFAPSLLGNQYLYLASDSIGASSSAYGWTADSNLITTKELTYGYYFGSIFSGTINNMLYCFADVTGVQKIGTYTADNQTTKNITTGFRPRFLLLKRTNSAQNWVLVDSSRGNNELYANTSGSDATEASIPTFYDDGFTLHNTRYNGGTDTYIYLAIA